MICALTKLIMAAMASLAFSALPASGFQTSKTVRSRATPASNGMTAVHASNISDDSKIELRPTERLLIEAKERRALEKERRERGLVQELGRTVKGDHLDGVRAMVWAAFGVSNYVFPALGVAFLFQLGARLAGYGFYFDEVERSFVIDTFDHIRFAQAASLDSWFVDASDGVQASNGRFS